MDDITDTMRLDFLAASGMSVVIHDGRNWACTFSGATPSVGARDWKPNIREAIDAAILDDMQSA